MPTGKPVFDTNLYFQKEYGVPVFIPISDDESYVAGKVETQEEALKNSLSLAKELLAYGFDPYKTYFIIDQIYTNIYNLAIKRAKADLRDSLFLSHEREEVVGARKTGLDSRLVFTADEVREALPHEIALYQR